MKGNKKGKKKDRKHRKRTRVKLNNGNYKLRTRERNVEKSAGDVELDKHQ